MQQALISVRRVRTCWLLVFLALLIAPAKLPAQAPDTKSETAAQASLLPMSCRWADLSSQGGLVLLFRGSPD